MCPPASDATTTTTREERYRAVMESKGGEGALEAILLELFETVRGLLDDDDELVELDILDEGVEILDGAIGELGGGVVSGGDVRYSPSL